MVTAPQPTLHLWSVEEYQQMIHTGILAPEHGVELIEGRILDMPAQDPLHATSIRLTQKLLERALEENAETRIQMPVVLSRSVPNPDLAIVRGTTEDYETRHPTPEDILLLVEVSNTTLSYDLEEKAQIYARDAISEYWVLDIQNRQLHVFRQPVEGEYALGEILTAEGEISPLHFPDRVFKVSAMLPRDRAR
jgi:Uma2 family endonuclease